MFIFFVVFLFSTLSATQLTIAKSGAYQYNEPFNDGLVLTINGSDINVSIAQVNKALKIEANGTGNSVTIADGNLDQATVNVTGQTHVLYSGKISSPVTLSVDGPSDIFFPQSRGIGSLSLKNGAVFQGEGMNFSGGKRRQNFVAPKTKRVITPEVEMQSKKVSSSRLRNEKIASLVASISSAKYMYDNLIKDIAVEPKENQAELIKKILNSAMSRVVTWEERKGDYIYIYEGPQNVSYIATRSTFTMSEAFFLGLLLSILSGSISLVLGNNRRVVRREDLGFGYARVYSKDEFSPEAWIKNGGHNVLAGGLLVSTLIPYLLYLSRSHVAPDDQKLISDMWENVTNIVKVLSEYNLVSEDFIDEWCDTRDEVEALWDQEKLIAGNELFIEFYKYTQNN